MGGIHTRMVGASGVGGGGGGGGATIRAHQLTIVASASRVITFVSGAAAGDRVFLFCTSAWGVTTPSGWTAHANDTGAFVNGAILSRVLDSGDISTGSVTLTFAGSYAEVVGQVCFVGDITVRDTNSLRQAPMSAWTATDGTPQIGDLALWWLGIRDGSASRSVDRGSVLENNKVGGGASGSGLLASETLLASGAQTVTFSDSGGTYYFASVVVH